ncbi:hypothetical protein F2P56_012223 [Juglans regia]|uniref:TIR domain-containing protein n=2 Tax=Juglans regia TaxID=51240 RepID=A0A833XIG5_JUGRE|nr:TMV resistance protein N-like isoform X2 [Juglans regia]KAF5468032.1 hypothetical protein F2P56_012223 [Juglans regia]
MASLTTQTSPSSSTHEWGVFLSFHGRDTRQRITAHLYKALEQRSISTFRDDKELERGRYISPELLNAIENSMYAVVVLSPYYAFSRWCLTELTKIVECMEKKGLILLPVFYQVDPFDVRNQKGTFTEAFVKHENDPKIVGDDLQSWKSALSKVGNISGWDLRDRDESTVIEEIVGEILAKLNSTFSTVSKKLVGIDSRLEKLMNLYLNIRQDDVRFLGIWGMGGIGKTTLARAVYDKISRQFKVSSFIANVRETSTRGAIVDLQKQLLSDLFKDKSSDIKDVDRGKNKIRHGLRHRRPVLVVVDDVDQSQQLEALAIERDWFGGGSVIIITTRDKHLLIERGLAEDEIYRAKEFDDDEALQLFSWKAFKKDLPLEGFVELSKQIIHYANGLPLAIEVLGRFLCRQNVEFWESALRCLSKNPKKEIVDTLKISFDGLEENEQKIFLDIACYFKGEKYIDRVKSILESCDYHPSSGIEILINKSLITISRGKLWMHDLLQEMGHEIVHRQSQGDPGRQSRLWHTNDIIRVLENNSGTNWIEGIVLNSPLQEELHLNSGVFLEMKNLRLLKIIGNVHLSQGLCYLSTELRVMEWHGYALKSLPMGFPPDKLVELNMRCSHIQQLWQGTKSLYKLEHVDLSDSRYLVETPDFTNAPNLKRLILQGCKKLGNLHSSVGALKRLIFLNLKGCTSLTSLPYNISWDSLEILILSGCTRLWKFPETMGNMNHLRQLSLDGIAFVELPSSIGHLTGLAYLSLRGCKSLLSLPSAICGLTSLKTLDLSGCSQLEEMPEGLGNLEHLEELDISETTIRQFPSSITRLQNLKMLSFHGCSGLPPTSLFKRFVTWFWGNPDTSLVLPTSLSSTPCNLNKLDLSYCHLMDGAVPDDLSGLSSLQFLNLSGNDFTLLPKSISQLSKLSFIYLRRCSQLRSLPELPSIIVYGNAQDCLSLKVRSIDIDILAVDAGSAIEKSTRKPRRLKNGQGDLLKEIRTIKTLMLRPED